MDFCSVRLCQSCILMNLMLFFYLVVISNHKANVPPPNANVTVNVKAEERPISHAANIHLSLPRDNANILNGVEAEEPPIGHPSQIEVVDYAIVLEHRLHKEQQQQNPQQ